jgi:hypothetical protein
MKEYKNTGVRISLRWQRLYRYAEVDNQFYSFFVLQTITSFGKYHQGNQKQCYSEHPFQETLSALISALPPRSSN